MYQKFTKTATEGKNMEKQETDIDREALAYIQQVFQKKTYSEN